MTGDCRLTDQVSERRYHLQTRYPIFEVLQKRESVFVTGLLETGEGVATASPRRTAGARTDFALLNHVAQIVLAAVVV